VLVPDGLLAAQLARQQPVEAHLSVFEYEFTVRRAAVAGFVRSLLITKLCDAYYVAWSRESQLKAKEIIL